MKQIIIIILLTLQIPVAFSQINYDDYFTEKTLRLDYTIGGNSDNFKVYFQQLKQEPFWSGPKTKLLDDFNFGDYKIIVLDSTKTDTIYTRGYSSLFAEWIDEKKSKTINRSFYESVIMPFPKHEINVKLQFRDKKTNFFDIFEIKISPNDYHIKKDKQTKFKSQKIYGTRKSNNTLDIVILPEGYTKEEMEKFHKDTKKNIDAFFEVEPFKSNKEKINFWIVDAISEESGTDIPGDNIWKNTILNSSFYTFDVERYLTTSDIKSVRDIAAYVPYDQIYILVNTEKYGGGGIYNYYNLCASDCYQSARIFTHEFGHAFAALADEYQYGFETAEELYDMSVEPWQANITNLSDFDKKWKNLTEKNTPIPTPNKFKDKIGAFEGAGYVKKGIYRPAYNCKMRSNSVNEFCPVCYDTVLKMLLFYTEE